MTGIRIAVAAPITTKDAAENGAKVRDLMKEAAAGQARLIQFPEGHLSGHPPWQLQDWSEVDWRVVHDELEKIKKLAARLKLWVVLGSAHPLTPPNRPHNSLYVISDDGRIVDRYDKRYCSSTEITRFFSPGFEPIVFDVDGYRFGCALEIDYLEILSEYDRLGVECLLLSAYPVESTIDVKARAAAAINNYWVAMSFPAQADEIAYSGLIDPDGTYVFQMKDTAELTLATIDRNDPDYAFSLTQSRPWRTIARKGDIYRTRRVTEDPRSTNHTVS
ncbi:carbon-nitrogen hydrolase family protein [Streptomyces sp. SID13031]|uniref:carbon-nitrogen hydrolase family protein n=1 Tax=Streptomyces sp. SID13031 TaxID=2706046 RepID=UPI0013CCB335|nr:carbon-nitrogen hydrolase family protein [Streptomyces sp. SID13031]NEA33276.1 carbon-nitrogen hydrolase family protein [Streptomyces sp. SID13031]